jgi:hypothetical protein
MSKRLARRNETEKDSSVKRGTWCGDKKESSGSANEDAMVIVLLSAHHLPPQMPIRRL